MKCGAVEGLRRRRSVWAPSGSYPQRNTREIIAVARGEKSNGTKKKKKARRQYGGEMTLRYRPVEWLLISLVGGGSASGGASGPSQNLEGFHFYCVMKSSGV